MFGFGDSRDARDEAYGEHKGSLTHEVIAGGVGFEAMKLWEDHQRKQGKAVSHTFAKEAIAGIAMAEVEKLFETKGLNYLDKEKAKRDAREHAERLYDEHHGGRGEWDPNAERHESFNY